jgi:hypothetical protein
VAAGADAFVVVVFILLGAIPVVQRLLQTGDLL